ncbi:hypothetical protein F4808DRAFT_156557 [Astrocystis sublimbata]|nr:hypothetical protein F4808DRAFT_156557 [Astrocystis sublimbata]
MIRSRPGKLRAACNQCAASKVKCSGEKTGCSSCENRGIECVFAESRVGRVPGMRGKRKLAHANANANANARPIGNTGDTVMGGIANAALTPLSPQTPDDLNIGEAIDLDCISSSTPSTQVPDTEHIGMGLFDDTLLGWSTMSNVSLDDAYGFDERYAEDIFGTLQDTPPELSPPQQQLSPMSQSCPNGASRPSLSHTASNTSNPTGIETSYQPPRMHDGQFSSRRSPATTTAATTPPQMTAADSERNNQCVIACSQIIFSLEKYQVDKLKVLDIILGIVKGVIRRLDPLVNGQFEGPNTKCLALFDIIMYQLVEILEAGCADFLANNSDSQRLLSMDLIEPGFHEVDLSGFGMGFKDQERFRSQNILDVLRPVIKTMQKMHFISTSAGLQRDNCSREGQGRLKSLEEKVRNRGEGVGRGIVSRKTW